uniref:SAM-dependent methyltransferase n=1 Tax=Sciscionella sediminilitoris TaxID=1445613 RepID=UPI00056A1F3D
VVYVDSETVAAIHARRKLEGDENSLVVQAELQDVDAVLKQSAALLDFTEPVAVMMVAILHFVPEEDDPRGIVNRYAETSAPGSYLIASHGTADGDLGNRLHDVVGEYKERANYNVHLRSKDEFAAILASYELVEPGITWARAWRPDEQTTDSDEAVAIYAAVGAKG